jgi:hypothetical protein
MAGDGVRPGVIAVDGDRRNDDYLILVDDAADALVAVPLDDDNLLVAAAGALLGLVHDLAITAVALTTEGLPVVLVVAMLANDLLVDNLAAAVLTREGLQDDDDGVAASVVADDMAGMRPSSHGGSGSRDGRRDDGDGRIDREENEVGDRLGLAAAESPFEEQVSATELGGVTRAGEVALLRRHDASACPIEGAATVASPRICQIGLRAW